MKNHTPTKRQEAAFSKAIKAIKQAQKLGLKLNIDFEGNLIAYRKEAMDYIESTNYNESGDELIPSLKHHCEIDSGESFGLFTY